MARWATQNAKQCSNIERDTISLLRLAMLCNQSSNMCGFVCVELMENWVWCVCVCVWFGYCYSCIGRFWDCLAGLKRTFSLAIKRASRATTGLGPIGLSIGAWTLKSHSSLLYQTSRGPCARLQLPSLLLHLLFLLLLLPLHHLHHHHHCLLPFCLLSKEREQKVRMPRLPHPFPPLPQFPRSRRRLLLLLSLLLLKEKKSTLEAPIVKPNSPTVKQQKLKDKILSSS